MTPTQVLLILASVGLSAVAQVLLKLGATGMRAGAVTGETSLVLDYQAMLSSPMTLAGLAAYGASALLWLKVLSLVPLSQAYPFVALGFVLTTAAGIFVLGEPLVFTRLFGTALILSGVLLVGYR